MRSIAAVLCFISILFSASSAHGADAAKTEYAERIHGLIAGLGSPSIDQRDGSEVALCMQAPFALDQMRAEVAKPDLSAEARQRLQAIIDREKPRQAARLRLLKQVDEERKWVVDDAINAYKKVGHMNPKWDDAAEQGLRRALAPDEWGTQADARGPLEQAIEAGCDDPLVLYEEAFTLAAFSPADFKTVEQLYCRADSILTSDYPNYFKEWAMLSHFNHRFQGAEAQARALGPGKRIDRTEWVESWHLLVHAMDAWPGVVREKPPLGRLWATYVEVLSINQQAHADLQRAWEVIDPPLERAMPKSEFNLAVKGNFYVRYAWQARGVGFANTVTEDGWKKFFERVALAQQALQKAWEMDPTDPNPPTLMLEVELGQGKGRPIMETWFKRAMEANPENRTACDQKMWYLMPRWYGSQAAMLEFGRQCFEEKNWYGRLPFLLVKAHVNVSYDEPDPHAYFRRPDVWHDLQSVYQPYLRAVPADAVIRSEFCNYACITRHWELAREQFKLLGSRASAEAFGGADAMRKLRDQAESNGAGLGDTP